MDWINLLLWIGGIYVAVSIIFYFFQHFFFFRPELLSFHFKYQYPFDFEEINFEMEDGGNINSIYFKVPNSRGVIFYFKGNSRSIKGWGKFAKDFVGNGYDFFMMDYRGFGKSRGKRTEQILFSDAQHLYKWLAKKYGEDKIVIYGRSLGSGISTRIASWNQPKMLILDSPYYSFYHTIKRFAFFLPLKLLMRYKILTNQFMKKVQCPVFIIHGTKDTLIPITQSRSLKAINPKNIQLFEIEGAGHNNLPKYGAYYELLYDILNRK